MNVNLLIDMVVRQTIVFIAQLATAPGNRASLAHVADRIFGELVAELRAQGVGAKVIASMFGMALSTWQQRVRRCEESATDRGRTLWEAVLTYVGERGGASKRQILDRFRHDDEATVRAVLRELHESGLMSSAGRGDAALFRLEPLPTAALAGDGLSALLRVAIYREGPSTVEGLARTLGLRVDEVAPIVSELAEAGEIDACPGAAGGHTVYSCSNYLIPLEAARGWEAAVFDHFQAVVGTLCARLGMMGGPPTSATAETGGSTYAFDLWADHPHEAELRGLLAELRGRLSALRAKTDACSARLGGKPEGAAPVRVTFYFGQRVESPEERVS